jgi:hypothetical protein
LRHDLPFSRHPQESFGFQRLWIFTVKPQEVAKQIPAGVLEGIIRAANNDAKRSNTGVN